MATEIEKLQRAKYYIDQLANGVNPITESPIDENDSANNVRIVRCFFYISGILDAVIQNGGVVGRRTRGSKTPFEITSEKLSQFPYSELPIPVSEITKRINELVSDENMSRLKTTGISNFLVENGFLQIVESPNGKKRKMPTPHGVESGITTELRSGMYGMYQVILYDLNMQHIIVDNIKYIIEINNTNKKG